MSGSTTMSSVPAEVRMISGRKRTSSTALGKKSAGMTDLARAQVRSRGRRSDAEADVHLALGEYGGVGSRNGRQKTGRIHAHPDHHDNQRNDGRPLAAVQIA